VLGKEDHFRLKPKPRKKKPFKARRSKKLLVGERPPGRCPDGATPLGVGKEGKSVSIEGGVLAERGLQNTIKTRPVRGYGKKGISSCREDGGNY